MTSPCCDQRSKAKSRDNRAIFDMLCIGISEFLAKILRELCRVKIQAIGVLLKAESLALIDSAYDKAKELKDKGFYISDQLLDDLSRYRK